MIDVVATVPHPPLLLEELAGAAAVETAELRAACRAAAARLADRATRWIAVGADPCHGEWGPATRGTFRAFGVDTVVSLGPPSPGPASLGPPLLGHRGGEPGPAPDPDLPLPLLVAGWLRDGHGAAGNGIAGDGVAVEGVVLSPDTPPAECRRRGAALAAAAADSPVPTGLLVLADGAATHTAKAPGAFDPRAAAYDDAVAAALAAADGPALASLAALDPTLADELWVGGRVGWQVLAGAAAGVTWTAEVLHGSRPYGVAYHVAVWERVA